MHFQNSKWKDFLGMTHSLLSHFFNFLCPTSASILWRMCRYIRISGHVGYIWINVDTKIILIVKHFYTYLAQCEVLTRYLTLARRPGSDLVNMWNWTKHFTILATYRWTRCPKEKQMIIPFAVQRQSQYLCNKHWMISTGSFCSHSLLLYEWTVNTFWQTPIEGNNKFPHTEVKISSSVTDIYTVINWTTAIPWF
jgi:hypothetical protein